MKRIHHLVALMLLICSSLHAQKAVHSFIIARPIYMGSNEKSSESTWAVSLIDELVRFRLEPLREIKVVPVPILKSIIPDISNPNVPISQKQYYNAATRFKTSYILTQKFELKNDKDFDYYLECISPDGNDIITSRDASFSLDDIASKLDSCLLGLLKQLNVTPTSQTTDFFRIPFLSKDAKPIKQLGELLAEEKSNKTPNYTQLSKEYEKLIEKNPFLLLANHAAGLAFFYSKDYDKSAKYLKELLDLAPLHSHLYLVLTRSYRLGKRYNEALIVLEQCDRMQLRTVPYLLEKALCYEGLNEISLALNVYTQILTLDPKQPQALYFLAKYQNDIAQYPQALTYAEKLISVAPQNGYGYFEHGRNNFATGNYDQALKSLEKANTLLPNNTMVLEWLGDLYMRQQDYSKASDFFHKAFAGAVNAPRLLLKTAQALEQSKKPKDALKLLKDNQITFSDNLQIKKAIGQLELANGNLDAAYNVLSKYLTANPNDGDVMWNMGNIYSKKSQHNQAIEIYLKALPLLDENKIQCKLAIAEQYLKRKDINKANVFLDEVIAEKPIKDANKLKGDAFMIAGDLRKAISYYDQERKIHGNNVSLQENIAKISFELNDMFYPAKKEYKQLVEMASDHTEAHYYLAIINLKEGNVKNAEVLLQKASKLGNGDAKIYFNLGLSYSQNKLDLKATEYYEKCIKQKENHIPALKNLSKLYVHIGKDSAAAETYIKLFNADNTQSQALAQAGHIFKKLKIYNRAIQTYDLFLNNKFTDFDINVSYASIVYEKKEYEKVIRLLKDVNGKWAEDELVLRILSDANCQTGNYKQALPLLKKLLLLKPENGNALKLAAIANEKTQDTVAAISMYERYLKLSPQKDHIDDAFHLGLLYEKQKMFKKALSQYEANVAQYPNDIRNYEQLGGLYTLFEDWKQAERILKSGIKLSNAKPMLTKMLAFTLYKQNNLAEATNYYTEYLNVAKTDADAWKLLGKIYFSQENYASSIPPLTKAVEYLPNDYNSLCMLGSSLVKTGEYSKAVAPLGRSRSLNDTNTNVIELLARCYRNLKETSTLTTLLKDWIAIDPKRYDIKMELGAIYLDENEITYAIQMFKDAVQFIPSQAKPYLLIAKAYEILGNDSLQLENLLKALRFAPDNWEIHYNLARYYLVKEKSKKAEEHLTTAIRLNPGNSTVHFEYGYHLLNEQKFAQSADELNTALEGEPNNSLYLAMYAYSLCMIGDTARSLENITVAVGKAPTDSRIKFWAGKVYLHVGKLQTARQLFNDALAINSSYADCYEALGDSYLKETKFKDASRYYFSAWEKGGYNELRAFKLGNSLSYDKKFLEAKDFYEAIINRNPAYSEVVYKLIFTYCELGDLDKAQKTLNVFTANDPQWKQLAQAKIYETEKNTSAALDALRIAKMANPDNKYLQSAYGRIYLETGDYESAIVALSSATAKDNLDMDVLVNLGKTFEKKNDPQSAFHYYIEVDKMYPEHPEIHERMANIKSAQKAHGSAIRILEKGIKYHSDNPNLYFLLGREQELADQYEAAISSYQTALKMGKGKPVEAFRYMGNIYHDKLVNSKKAKEFYKKYVKTSDNQKLVAEVMKKLENI